MKTQYNQGSMPTNDGKTQWLIRTESGQQIGPYNTQAVLKLIGDGSLKGLEQIRKYPDGKWLAISREPEFYDQLLEVLEKPKSLNSSKTQIPQRPKEQIPINEETVIRPLSPAKMDENQFEATVVLPGTKAKPEKQAPSAPQRIPNFKPVTLNLESEDRVLATKKKKGLVFPAMLLVIGLSGVLWLLTQPQKPNTTSLKETRMNLLDPTVPLERIGSPEQIKIISSQAVNLFTRDTPESYWEAQTNLMRLMQTQPQNVEARGLLCLVYKELWPHVKQDSKDLDAIHFVSKSVRSIDPIGVNSIYCEVTKLLTLGKFNEARGLVDHSLNQAQFSTAPILYLMKAEILSEEGDFKSAALYAEKSSQLWPEWNKTHFEYGKNLLLSKDLNGASKKFLEITERFPKHKASQLYLGNILYESFGRNAEALQILTATLASPGKVESVLESHSLFNVAKLYMAEGQKEKAVQFVKKSHLLNPTNKAVRDLAQSLGAELKNQDAGRDSESLFLGDQYYRQGNYLSAQAEYKAAFEQDSKNAMAAYRAALCLWKLNQGLEAISWLDRAIGADTKLTIAHVTKANYLSQRYSFAEAMVALNKAAAIFPNNYQVLRGYGLVELRRNNFKDALSFLQRSHKLFENDSETLIALAQAFGLSGDFASAQRYAVRAIELDSTNTEAQIMYARILAQFRGLETGVVYLRDLINRFSYTLEYRVALADLYREQERYKDAQVIYEQIITIQPKHKKSFLGLGESLQGQGLFSAALKPFLSATVLDPSDPEGLVKAGLLYMEMNKFSEAIIQFQRALKVNSQYPKINFYIGKAAYESGNYELGLQSADAERQLNPNLADSYILAGEIYSASKQFQKCANEYQQAVRLRPVGSDLYVKLARCHRQAGSPEVAESMLNIAATQESGNPEIYKELGAVLEVRGDRPAAVKAFEKYLGLSPNAPDRRDVESKISALSR
ncbi:MAG: tetratricopeptide repeat protein [Pseudobdellovibrionaceae bacterium]